MPKSTQGNPIQFNTDRNLEIKNVSVPPSTPKKKEEKKDWTPEEAAEMARITMVGLGLAEPPKKEAEKPELKEKTEEAAAPAKEVEEKQPEDQKETPAPKKPTKPAKIDESLADKIGDRIAAENEKLISRLTPKQDNSAATGSTQPTEDEEENNHLREVFQIMATMNPANAELPKKFEEFDYGAGSRRGGKRLADNLRARG